MKDFVMEPTRSSGEKKLPENGFLFINPQDFRVAEKQFVKQGGEKRFLFNSNLLVDKTKTRFISGPAIGAPMAVMVLEKLIALGCKRIVIFGWCGGLENEMSKISVGDLVQCGEAVCGEGTSQYYSGKEVAVPSNELLVELQDFLIKRGLQSTKCVCWSTDAPYRESRKQLEVLKKKYGAFCIDMELSALATVAELRKIELANIFVVSDMIGRDKHEIAFNTSCFKGKRDRIITELIQAWKMEKNI